MSKSAVKLLRAVCEIVGGDRALAKRLGIREALLSKFMSGKYPLPDVVLFRAVDAVLEDRESRRTPPAESAAQPVQEPKSGD